MQAHDDSYSLRLRSTRDYLAANVSCPSINRKIKLSYFSEIAISCSMRSSRRVLLTRDVPNLVNSANLQMTLDDVVAMASGLRVAFINPYDEIEVGLRRMIAYCVEHEADFGYFRDAEAAKKWLRSG